MVCEVKVALTTEDGKYTKKHLVYDRFIASLEDAFVRQCIDDTLSECKAEVEKVNVTIKILSECENATSRRKTEREQP